MQLSHTKHLAPGHAMTIHVFAATIERLDIWVLWFSIGVMLVSAVGVVLWHLLATLVGKLTKRKTSRLALEPRPWSTMGEDAELSTDKRARQLLTRARQELNNHNLASCLECCIALGNEFPDLPEAEQARQLRVQIRSDPERLRQACAVLVESLAEMYLELAESWLQQGDRRQAAEVLQRLLRNCAETRAVPMARDRLGQLNAIQLPPQAIQLPS
jgi:hypothetical protein